MVGVSCGSGDGLWWKEGGLGWRKGGLWWRVREEMSIDFREASWGTL